MRARWGFALLWSCMACADAHGPGAYADSGGEGGDSGAGADGGSGGDVGGSGGAGGVGGAQHADASIDDAGIPDATVGLPLCPWAEPSADCERSTYFTIEPLLSASTFGPDARFIAADERFVLVTRDSDVDLLVDASLSFDGEVQTQQWELPEGLRAVDLGYFNSSVIVLACDDSACRLLWLDYYGGSELHDEAASTLPLGFEARGLTRGLYVADRGDTSLLFPCAYGRGLRCFDGEQWRVELADVPLLGAAMATPHAVLTTDGRVRIRAGDGRPWNEITDLHVTSPRWIDAAGMRGVGLPIDRWTWAWIDNAGVVSRCNAGAAFASLRSVSDVATFGVATSGDSFAYFDWRPESDTCIAHQVDDGPAIDLTLSVCGLGNNVRHLTASTLRGTTFCAIE